MFVLDPDVIPYSAEAAVDVFADIKNAQALPVDLGDAVDASEA